MLSVRCGDVEYYVTMGCCHGDGKPSGEKYLCHEVLVKTVSMVTERRHQKVLILSNVLCGYSENCPAS